MAKTFWKIVLSSFLIFFFSWMVVYKTGLNDLAIQSEDTLPAMFLPISIIKEGTLYADSYYDLLLENYPHPDDKSYEKGLTPFYFRKVGTHYVSAFTIISGILPVPIYFIPIKLGLPITLENITVLSHLSSSFIAALCGGFFYLFVNKNTSLGEKKSVLLSMLYLFATVNYSMVSQALWQHGPLQLFTLMSLYFLYDKKWFWAAVALGFAVLSRPTAIVFVPFLGLLALFIQKNMKFVPGFLLGFLIPVGFFFWYNKMFYVDISNQGYSSQIFTEWLGRFPEGFLGIWFSPSKGILVYSPVFLFSIFSFYLGVKQKKVEYFLYFCIVFLYTMLMGRWKHWYGGYSFGYRMASDVLPFLCLLLVPFISSHHFSGFRVLFMVLFSISVFIQVFGLVFFDGVWHGTYDKGFVDTRWLWSVKNSEFVFGFRRVLVKLGVLSKPREFRPSVLD